LQLLGVPKIFSRSELNHAIYSIKR